MTRKHYKAIAAALADVRRVHIARAAPNVAESRIHAVLDDATIMLAAVCGAANARFDRQKFLDACGYQG